MVTEKERKFVLLMIRLNLWTLWEWMRLVDLRAKFGTRWVLKILKRKQIVDDLHHAPGCPANHYHMARLVFQSCTCGAKNAAR